MTSTNIINESFFVELQSTIRTFDIIAMRGTTFADVVVHTVFGILNKRADYTHVLLCILGSDFPESSPYYSLTRLYALEACPDIGVKLIDLEPRLQYWEKQSTLISLCKLKKPPIVNITPEKLQTLIDKFISYGYEYNFVAETAGVITIFKTLRDEIIYPLREATGTHKYINCSQLVATIMQEIGEIDKNICVADVIPIDLLEIADLPHQWFPKLWNAPINFTT
jgi:hypothetical protein